MLTHACANGSGFISKPRMHHLIVSFYNSLHVEAEYSETLRRKSDRKGLGDRGRESNEEEECKVNPV